MIVLKNVTEDELNEYNQKRENGDILYKYLKGNMIHLEEDIKKCKKAKGYEKQQKQFEIMYENCEKMLEKITFKKPLLKKDFKKIEILNLYNAEKNEEMKRLVMITIVFVLIALILSKIL